MKQLLFENWYETPLGRMLSLSDEEFLYLLEFEERKNLAQEISCLQADIVSGETRISRQIGDELAAYFAGTLTRFITPIKLPGTDFQRQVWQAVIEIPLGKTVTYKDIAEKIGKPRAGMAVGAAVGSNQLALIVPCHRVVRTDGGLAGYAAGLWRKEKLLAMERAQLRA